MSDTKARTIWKFTLQLTGGVQTLSIPSGHQVLHVGRDPATGLPAVWADVNPDSEKVDWPFYVVGTGHSIPPTAMYWGTAACPPFVWHIYEGYKP